MRGFCLFLKIKRRFDGVLTKISYDMSINHYCMKESFILQWFEDSNELLNVLGIKLTREDQKTIQQFQKEAIKYKSASQRIEQKM